MFARQWTVRTGRRLLIAAATMTLAAGAAVGVGTPSQAATQEPCDIYAAGGTPCVAAHSTTRALYGAYSGNLYQVRRSSDNATLNIGVLSAGGYANAAAQDSFCSGTTCLITVIYDQSGRGNNLTEAPAGGAAGGPDNLANATAAPTTLNGQRGLRRLCRGRHRLPRQQHQWHRHRRQPGRRVRDLRRHPLQRRLLLRLRQRRDRQP